MIKALVNWLYTERLIEVASRIPEKKKRPAGGEGTLNPVRKALCAISGSMRLKGKARSLVNNHIPLTYNGRLSLNLRLCKPEGYSELSLSNIKIGLGST